MTGGSGFLARVLDVVALSPSLKRIRLGDARGGLLPVSPPGGHIVLTLGDPADMVWRNAYSLTSPIDQRSHYEIIVRHVDASRGGSAFIHQRLGVGDVLNVTGPDTFFPLRATAHKHVLIGGGIGVTPFLSFLPVLRAQGARVEMHQLALPREIAVFEALLAPHASDVTLHPASGAFDFVPILARQPLGTHLYVCGPGPMMAAVIDTAVQLGWPTSAITRESFGATGGTPFLLRLGRTGKTVQVGPMQTMLEAIEAAGHAIDFLCRGGACGRCLTRVIEGVPDHHDHVLDANQRASNRWVMPCVSRAQSDLLVLDLEG